MSFTSEQLQKFVSLMMVNSDNNSVVSNNNGELTFCQGVDAETTVDGLNWRERLHTFMKKYQVCIPPENSEVHGGVIEKMAPTTLPTATKSPLALSPTVNLCDILKEVSPKADFLNYFELANQSGSKPKSIVDKYIASHPRTLGNCPNIPFSSDVGRKLIKDWHQIPEEIHMKKLERLERYLSTNPEAMKVTHSVYKVTYNRKVKYSHFYQFPTKNYHRQKLTPKARKLKNLCKPCSVRLIRTPEKPVVLEFQKTIKQKENILKKFERHQPQVLLTNYHSPKSKDTTLKPLENTTSTLVLRTRNIVLKSTARKVSCQKKTVPQIASNNQVNASVVVTPIDHFFGVSKNCKKPRKVIDKNYPRRISARLHDKVKKKALSII